MYSIITIICSNQIKDIFSITSIELGIHRLHWLEPTIAAMYKEKPSRHIFPVETSKSNYNYSFIHFIYCQLEYSKRKINNDTHNKSYFVAVKKTIRLSIFHIFFFFSFPFHPEIHLCYHS